MRLDGSTFLITGGTGSFGHAMCRRLLRSEVEEIRIFSRDEKKQDDMRKQFSDPRIKFYLGDVRDRFAVDSAMNGVTHVFHAAALKQVPSCEFFPMEAVKTNVEGANNVVRSAVDHEVLKVVALSTDKAVAPVNAMGMSKALMEKVVSAKARELGRSPATVMCCTRYGNVIASRGSVVPLFFDQIRAGRPLTITDLSMTRFMMTLSDAIELVLYAMEEAKGGEVFVRKAPGATVKTIISAVEHICGVTEHPVKEIGIRHGEKMHEMLVSPEELGTAIDAGSYFVLPMDQRDLNYDKFFFGDDIETSLRSGYTSDFTDQLTGVQLAEILSNDEDVRAVIGVSDS